MYSVSRWNRLENTFKDAAVPEKLIWRTVFELIYFYLSSTTWWWNACNATPFLNDLQHVYFSTAASSYLSADKNKSAINSTDVLVGLYFSVFVTFHAAPSTGNTLLYENTCRSNESAQHAPPSTQRISRQFDLKGNFEHHGDKRPERRHLEQNVKILFTKSFLCFFCLFVFPLTYRK